MKRAISDIKNNILNIFSKNNFFANILNKFTITKDSTSYFSQIFRIRNIVIVMAIFVIAVIVGIIIGRMNKVEIDVQAENRRLFETYTNNNIFKKNKEIILPENNTPINRIPQTKTNN